MRPVVCELVALVGILTLASDPARADEASDTFRVGARRLQEHEPRDAFRAGVRLLEEHKPRDAVESFRKVAELAPQYPEVFIYLGDAWLQLRKYGEAAACYNRSLESDAPGEATSRALTGLGCAHLGLATGPKREDFAARAIWCFDLVIKDSPRFAPSYHNRGRAYHLRKDLDRAIADFDKAIELDPAHADAYENRGKAWEDKGDRKRAAADAARARELRARTK